MFTRKNTARALVALSLTGAFVTTASAFPASAGYVAGAADAASDPSVIVKSSTDTGGAARFFKEHEFGKSIAKRCAKIASEKVSWKQAGASTYGIGDGLLGSGCADGSKVTKTSMGVAHKTLALGTRIQVSYKGKTVKAVVHDRGPYVAGRDLDLQPAVAHKLGFDGVGQVKYRIVE